MSDKLSIGEVFTAVGNVAKDVENSPFGQAVGKGADIVENKITEAVRDFNARHESHSDTTKNDSGSKTTPPENRAPKQEIKGFGPKNIA